MENSKTMAFIYARLDSLRLPRKPLISIDGVKVLDAVYARAERLNVKAIAVLTTDRRVDGPIVSHCAENGYECFKGDPENLVRRTVKALETYGADRFVRVNADCPLFEPTLVNYGLAEMDKTTEVEFVTNVLKRTFPYGISVECIKADTYAKHTASARSHEVEHVTQHLSRLSNRVQTHVMLDWRGDNSASRLTLDTATDLQCLKHLCSAEELVYAPYWQVLSIDPPVPFFVRRDGF